jgi:hypothetical protein
MRKLLSDTNEINNLLNKYPACATYEFAIYILDFIKRGYEKQVSEGKGCQKYVDALNIGIDAIKEKQNMR